MALSSHMSSHNTAVTFGCSLTFRSEEHNGYLEVHGANESPVLRLESNGAPLLRFDSSIFSLVREGFVGLVTEKEIRYNSIVCLVNTATRTTANVQLTDGSEKGLRVLMHSSTKPTALRISPKYKTHSSSEFVHHGDKVAFGIDDTDLFLRIAEREDGSHELVAASEPTVFDLKRFDRGAAPHYCSMANYVQAGRTLSIYHRVHDMFLSHSPVEADKQMLKKAIKRNTLWQVAEAAGTERHLANEEIGVREEAEKHLKHSNVFFSEAITTGALEVVDPGAAGLWVIEAADPTVGGPLRIGEMYRLRHFASGGYLAIRESMNSEIDFEVLVISPDEADMTQDTLFDVEAPAENDLGHVSTVQSVVRFKHVRTGKWLSTLDLPGTIITPATVHEKGHNRDRLRLRHIPELVESELQFAVGHLRHFQGWIEHFETLQNMPRSLTSIMTSKDTRAVVVRTVESLLALIDLVCRAPNQTRSTAGSGNSGGNSSSGTKQIGGGPSSGAGGGGSGSHHHHHHQGGSGGGGSSSGGGGGGGSHAHLEKLGLPDPIRQRRLHELGVENLLLRVALAPFQSRGVGFHIPPAGGVISIADVGMKECTPIVTAVRLCFQLLRSIVKGSPQHCRAAMPMVDMMIYLESHQLHVAPALLAVLEHGGSLKHCQSLLKLNDIHPHAAYIDSIAHYCVNEQTVQDVIGLIGQHRRTLVRAAIEYGRLMFAHHTIGRQGTDDDDLLTTEERGKKDDDIGTLSMEDLVDRFEAVTFDVFITQEESHIISYFVATLRLFLAIARHGGTAGLEFARGHILREEILIVFGTSFKDTKNQNQSDIVKATYAELATCLYLGKEAQRQISSGLAPVIVDPTGTLRGTSARAIGAGTATDFHGQSVFSQYGDGAGEGTFLRQLKISALEFIKDHPVQVVELTGQNQMMWNCISIWHVFVQMRTASIAELKEVIPLLLHVLDGATDVQSLVTQDWNWDRYVLSEDSLNVLKTKTEICSLLETFVRQLQEEFAAIVNEKLSQGKDNAEVIINAAEKHVAELKSVLNVPRLVHILLDLILYESPDLMTAATSLLTAVCNWRDREKDLIEDMHLLPQSSEKLMQNILDICSGIAESDPNDRAPLIDRFVSFYKGPVSQDDVARAHAGRPRLSSLILDSLRAWRTHEAILDVLPTDPTENLDLFLSCIDFFLIFAKTSTNAEVIAEHWPVFFTAMQKHQNVQGPVLQLLRLIWARGNRLTPVQHADIKFVISLIDPVDSLEVLPTVAALLNQGIPSHQLQRDVLNILIDFDILKANWWIRLHGQMTTHLTNVLELCAAGGNPYTNSIVTSRLPLVVVVRQLHSTGMAKITVKCVLVRFATVAHFSESVAARAAADTTEVIVGELWWRLIRDDFMVRLDELPAALDVADSLKQYIVELSSLLIAFFENRFQLAEVLRYEAIVKELRHVASTVHHVCSSLMNMKHLSPSERFVLYKLAKAVHNSLRNLKDHSVVTLGDAIQNIDEKALLESPVESLRKNNINALYNPSGKQSPTSRTESQFPVTPTGDNNNNNKTSSNTNSRSVSGAPQQAMNNNNNNNSGVQQRTASPGASRSYSGGAGAGAGAGSLQDLGMAEFLATEQKYQMCQQRLDEAVQIATKRADEDTTIEILVAVLASLDFFDVNCWKQRVIRRLLLAVQRQQFAPDAICIVLRAVRMCIESVEGNKDKFIQMQNMMEALGALPVATRLFDAVNTEIIVEALKLGIATLLDGNARAQNHFLDYLLATEEKMFFAIKRCCERSSLELFYWRRSQKNARETVDLHDKDLVFNYLKLMLRFVQLLCEGHNLGLQDYVREQHDNIRSINTLHCVVALMKTLLLGATQPVEDELIQCFELCTEVCQGPCANNQLALISSGCGSLINSTLMDPTISLDVKSSAITTLLSLLEGCTDPQIAEVIERSVPITTLDDLYKLTINDEASDAVVYSVGIFLRILHDLFKGKRRAAKIHEILSSRPDIARKTGIIQIERNDEIERVYFRTPDACLNIREESKRRLLWDVDRTSQSAKLASFVELADDLILEMDLTEQHIVTAFDAIKERIPQKVIERAVPHSINPAVEFWIFLSAVLAGFHNLLFLFDIFDFYIVNASLGLVQVGLSVVIIFIDWQVASNVYFHKYKKQKRQNRVGSSTSSSSALMSSSSSNSSSSSDSKNHGKSSAGGDHHNSNNDENNSKADGSNDHDNDTSNNTHSDGSVAGGSNNMNSATAAAAFGNRRDIGFSVTASRELLLRLSRPRAIQSTSFLLFAIIGTIYTPYCLGIHLLWIIDLSPAFQNVVAAITLNAKTLSLTIVLGFLFLYFFSMVGYSMFSEDFDTDDDPMFQENCASLSNCFFFMLTTGLRQGGGVGDVMRPKSWKQPQFFARKLFDFAFFAFMIIVFLNILFGIIIDTFAELRDAKSRKEEDMRLKCFVCGIDSHVFDRHGEGFLWHIKHEHSMWQYLYFLHHLRVKDPANYTGQESYISRLLDRKDFSFFPQRCLSLEAKTENRGLMADDGILGPSSSASAGNDVGSNGRSSNSDGSGLSKQNGGGGNSALSAQQQMQMAAMMSHHGHTNGGSGAGGGGMFLDAAALQGHFDKLALQLRKAVVQNSSGGTGGSAEPSRRVPGGGARRIVDSHRWRPALDVACQTSGGDSLVSLQFQLQQARQEVDKLNNERKEMKEEMKLQVEELWKMRSSVQNMADAQNRIHALESQLANKHRECDLAYAERDAVLRQNAFLQKEADRLLLTQTQAEVAQKMRGPASQYQPSPLHALRDSMIQRSHLYDALQIPDSALLQQQQQQQRQQIDENNNSSSGTAGYHHHQKENMFTQLQLPQHQQQRSGSTAQHSSSTNTNNNSTQLEATTNSIISRDVTGLENVTPIPSHQRDSS